VNMLLLSFRSAKIYKRKCTTILTRPNTRYQTVTRATEFQFPTGYTRTQIISGCLRSRSRNRFTFKNLVVVTKDIVVVVVAVRDSTVTRL
jgi:hypothetical protein